MKKSVTRGRNVSRARKRLGLARREKNPRWNGGVMITRGYRYILFSEHPDARPNGYILEHRVIAEQIIGRRLKRTEIVHHINKNTLDNRPENLKILSDQGQHRKEHKKICWAMRFICCVHCGTTRIKHHSKGRCKRCHDKLMYSNRRSHEDIFDFASSNESH